MASAAAGERGYAARWDLTQEEEQAAVASLCVACTEVDRQLDELATAETPAPQTATGDSAILVRSAKAQAATLHGLAEGKEWTLQTLRLAACTRVAEASLEAAAMTRESARLQAQMRAEAGGSHDARGEAQTRCMLEDLRAQHDALKSAHLKLGAQCERDRRDARECWIASEAAVLELGVQMGELARVAALLAPLQRTARQRPRASIAQKASELVHERKSRAGLADAESASGDPREVSEHAMLSSEERSARASLDTLRRDVESCSATDVRRIGALRDAIAATDEELRHAKAELAEVKRANARLRDAAAEEARAVASEAKVAHVREMAAAAAGAPGSADAHFALSRKPKNAAAGSRAFSREQLMSRYRGQLAAVSALDDGAGGSTRAGADETEYAQYQRLLAKHGQAQAAATGTT